MDSAPAPVKRDPLEALRAAFGTGDLRRLQFGWAATSVGTWAFMVVLAVYAYDVGYRHTSNFCLAFKRHFGRTAHRLRLAAKAR